MRIVNRHTRPIYLEFYKGDEIEPDNALAGFRVAIEKRSLDPGGSYERGMGYDDVQIGVTTTSADGRMGFALTPTKQRRFRNTTLVLFTTDGQQRLFLIDWPAVLNAWTNRGQAVRTRRGDDAVAAKGLAIGAMVLGGLVTGIAATGPVGAIPAGILLVGGSLLLMAFGTELQRDGAATLAEIESSVERIVTTVVQDQLHQQDARKAAARIMLDTRNLLEVAALVASENAQTPNRAESHYEQDLREFVENVMRGEGSESLSYWLELLHQEPEIAKYILPLYILGIGTLLQVKRMHYLQAASEPIPAKRSPVTTGVVQFYRGEVHACLIGLTNALAAFERFRDTQMEADASLYVPEGSAVKEIFHKMYLGEPTTSKVSEAIAALTTVEQKLDEDITGPITNFWRPDWSRHLPAATP